MSQSGQLLLTENERRQAGRQIRTGELVTQSESPPLESQKHSQAWSQRRRVTAICQAFSPEISPESNSVHSTKGPSVETTNRDPLGAYYMLTHAKDL